MITVTLKNGYYKNTFRCRIYLDGAPVQWDTLITSKYGLQFLMKFKNVIHRANKGITGQTKHCEL